MLMTYLIAFFQHRTSPVSIIYLEKLLLSCFFIYIWIVKKHTHNSVRKMVYPMNILTLKQTRTRYFWGNISLKQIYHEKVSVFSNSHNGFNSFLY